MNLTLYIMCGLAFSGKSTLAKEIAKYTNAILVSQDSIWFETEKGLGKEPDYHMILEISKQRVRDALKSGKSVVFDNTNAGHKHREEFRQIANECRANAVVIYLNTSDEEIKRRRESNKISKERHQVKDEDIKIVRDKFEIPTLDENVKTYQPNEDLSDWLKKSIAFGKK